MTIFLSIKKWTWYCVWMVQMCMVWIIIKDWELLQSQNQRDSNNSSQNNNSLSGITGKIKLASNASQTQWAL